MTGMLVISVSARPPDVMMKLEGECDITTAPQLATALTGIPSGCRRLIIDLSGLEFIDAAGIHALVNARDSLAAHDVQLNATDAQPVVSRMLELTGASQIMSVVSGARPEGFREPPDRLRKS